jgi:hypothetical protein
MPKFTTGWYNLSNMRFRIALALLVSILFIGASSWSRLKPTGKVEYNILTVEQAESNDDNYQDFLQDFLEPKKSDIATPTKPLSNTDLLGRNLLLDYIGLAANGAANTYSINALANQYVENIPTLLKFEKVSYEEIKTISDTKSNFENYSNELGRIYAEHAKRISLIQTNRSSLDDSNNAYFLFAEAANTIYKDTFFKLKDLSVPTSIALVHLQLVNSQLSSAAAMESISKIERDSATAFAGFIVMRENLDEEVIVLKEIEKILKTNGI